MALVLHLKYVENLRSRGDRLAKVSFRGVSHYTKIVENAEDSVLFDETFEWPVARPVEVEEIIDIQLYNHNKYLSNKLVGTFRMILQQLVEVGNLKISDCLLDANNVVMQTKVTFELTYNAPDGSVGTWQTGGFERLASDEFRRPLSEEERNQLNLEHSLGDGEIEDSTMSSPTRSYKGSTLSLASKTSKTSSSKSPKHISSKLTSVVKMAMITKKQRPSAVSSADLDYDNRTLCGEDFDSAESNDLDARAAEVASMLAATAQQTVDNDNASEHSAVTGMGGTGKRARPLTSNEDLMMKAQDFQVCVTVIEARQLAGLNMDPVVCVQVGDQKKYTSVKESTNCPYYSEYFVFDFHMPPIMLFDKIITLTACHSGRLLRMTKPVGAYKLDVATVYAQPDHQFYHKWAMLTDPDDINGGVKGYLKCDIAVIGKGDSVKVPPKSDKDEDDIEANLLLPDGVPADRSRARFCVKIYKADGLPKMNAGIVANVKRAFTGESKDLVDPYVEVSFAGHQGRTSVKKGSYEPAWNEQVVFTEMFPPLCRRIKIQLRDSDAVNDDVIGTHFIDLSQVANEGEKGFLPTYGPCWVNLYGSTRYYQILEKHQHLNDGIGEGVSFRGRLLIAIKTDILDSQESGPSNVEVEPALPISEMAAGMPEEYFLFGCVLEASMIDRKLSEKPIHFECSIGNAGNVLDGYNPPCRRSGSSDSDEDSEAGGEDVAEDEGAVALHMDTPKWQSTTPSMKPVTRDRLYYHLPYYEEKPCIYVKESMEDHRRRMYNSNIVDKIADKLEDGLSEVHEKIAQEMPFPERRLRGVFEELGQGCSKFVSLVRSTGGGSAAGKTKLDKERHKLLVREMDQLSTLARTMKATVTKNNMKEKLRAGQQYLNKLRSLEVEPQHALPDLFIWLISNNRRVAYHRIPARQLIYSIVDEERGKDCGKVLTLLLKLPGKKASGQAGWTIQTKLQVYFWLGLSKHKKDFMQGLPRGFEETKSLKNATKPNGVPPRMIHYTERQVFQLRAHMYQARQLIGSDASGLSDPYACVTFGDQSVSTQVIDETLSPTWDEMLIVKEVEMFGLMEEIFDDPPTIVVEIFDKDNVGKSEFIGRALCKPVVKMSSEEYAAPKFPPRLEWWDVYRGTERAGELLATFELLQYPFEESDLQRAHETPPYARKKLRLAPFGDTSGQDLPPMELPALDKDRGPIMPVPKGIRPVLSKHRIEVLFWGVRDIKRIHLQQVDRPRIDIECAGHVLSSTIIQNCKKNPNFSVPVKYFDVELPENELYCPPISIRCVDCRSFGRFTLVGTHVISNLHKFMYIPTTRQAKAALQKLFPLKGRAIDQTKVIVAGSPAKSVQSEDVAITVDENLPLINKDAIITITSHDNTASEKEKKTAENKRRKGGNVDEDELDMDALDWWSKYFASVETMIRRPYDSDDEEHEPVISGDESEEEKTKEEKKEHGRGEDVFNMEALEAESKLTEKDSPPNTAGYGSIPNGAPVEGEVEFKQTKKVDKEAKKAEKKEAGEKKTFKGAAKAVALAKQLSPRTQRKKDKLLSSTAQLKGFFNKVFQGDDDDDHFSEVSDKYENIEKFPGFRKYFSRASSEGSVTQSPAVQIDDQLVVFPNELEAQPEYDGFHDWLHTFELYRGKNTGSDESDEGRIVGKFKGSMRIYKIPLPPDIEDCTITGGDPNYGLFQGLPSNEPVKVLVRVYIVKANDLHPADINGKADPYLVIRLGSKVVNDKENYISKQLNPVFGKCMEFEATFPMESLLAVQVFDWDLVGMDDLIGETKVDLENRYYSRHRATCGLGKKYELHGYNAWRDPMKPTAILAKLCKDGKVDGPYYQPGKVRIANRIFEASSEIEDETARKKKKIKPKESPQLKWRRVPDARVNVPGTSAQAAGIDNGGYSKEGDEGVAIKTVPVVGAKQLETFPDLTKGVKKVTDEHVALAALNNWHEIPKVGCHLLPEHVETRPLFNPEKPGIEQGKIEMWVDMFPMDMPAPGAPVDISPRKPRSYELRCIIWNTDDVVLEDDAFFTGEKMSDIYVKGWIKGSDDMQATDIHYRSLTGEGNFNWRFVFPFDYLVAEEKIVISRKETLFSWDETESKIPARLNLQVWDADHFSADDFLGALTLDLNRFPRGAKSAKLCTLGMLKTDGSVPQMSLFKHKRVKGWWPFAVKNEGEEEFELTGKVEAELHLFTQEEAEKHPAGLGRSEPDPLEKPNRPDSSFMWFMNPLKSLRYILWHNYKWMILKLLVVALLTALLVLFFYSMPGYTVKKIFGA